MTMGFYVTDFEGRFIMQQSTAKCYSTVTPAAAAKSHRCEPGISGRTTYSPASWDLRPESYPSAPRFQVEDLCPSLTPHFNRLVSVMEKEMNMPPTLACSCSFFLGACRFHSKTILLCFPEASAFKIDPC